MVGIHTLIPHKAMQNTRPRHAPVSPAQPSLCARLAADLRTFQRRSALAAPPLRGSHTCCPAPARVSDSSRVLRLLVPTCVVVSPLRVEAMDVARFRPILIDCDSSNALRMPESANSSREGQYFVAARRTGGAESGVDQAGCWDRDAAVCCCARRLSVTTSAVAGDRQPTAASVTRRS